MGNKKKIGPAALVAAAFIGPGTVTACTIAGVTTGFDLLWVLVLSIISTIVFQEMAARLGLITQKGLSEAIVSQTNGQFSKVLSFFLIISAIFIGNAAYEAGNISGAVLGIEAAFPMSGESIGFKPVNLLLGILAFGVLLAGKYKLIEKVLIVAVGLMAVAFIFSAIAIGPSITAILKGIFIPKLPAGNVFLAIAIVGTTVVPYNLFLHASAVKEKWHDISDLKAVRWDTKVAIVIGGIISACVVIVAAGSTEYISEVRNASDLATGLEPVLGASAKYALATGMFAAGLSSSITAPLGAAYAISGLFGGNKKVFKFSWMLVLGIGVLFSTLSFSPIVIIQYAQVTNGILLPIIALFLLRTVNNRKIMGDHINSKSQNALAALVLFITVLLAFRSLYNVFVG